MLRATRIFRVIFGESRAHGGLRTVDKEPVFSFPLVVAQSFVPMRRIGNRKIG